ncbi:hypothetical protein H2198_006691 [Neophaeococcomyces mojaviensis]|uniref:Uncharacterized protein n=1 Tax=Neophaeococcomyces mojaviensis TaxID=3383035 RepID=A0ACC3A294_9EURO|nr:hypothetical protein H2198_006691 [Knufia sp. JES_112]
MCRTKPTHLRTTLTYDKLHPEATSSGNRVCAWLGKLPNFTSWEDSFDTAVDVERMKNWFAGDADIGEKVERGGRKRKLEETSGKDVETGDRKKVRKIGARVEDLRLEKVVVDLTLEDAVDDEVQVLKTTKKKTVVGEVVGASTGGGQTEKKHKGVKAGLCRRVVVESGFQESRTNARHDVNAGNVSGKAIEVV